MKKRRILKLSAETLTFSGWCFNTLTPYAQCIEKVDIKNTIWLKLAETSGLIRVYKTVIKDNILEEEI